MIDLLAALLVGAGLAGMVVGVLQRGRDRERELAAILDLPFAHAEVVTDEPAPEEHGFFEPGVAVVNAALRRIDVADRIQAELIRARVPSRRDC